jgi:hypothetical protein
LNSVIYALIHVPMVTVARCSQAADDSDPRVRSISCTPDFAPVFNFATASVRYGGILADNWLDVAWITIRSMFGDEFDGCAPSPVTLRYEATQSLFGGNETRLVGLGPTSYALTDGNSVQYVFFRGKTDPVRIFGLWPFLVPKSFVSHVVRCACPPLCFSLLKAQTVHISLETSTQLQYT